MHQRLLLGLVVLLATSACDKKAEGQTVAVVNGEEITAAELNAEIAQANLPEGVDRKAATARILQGLVDRRLLASQAREEGIDRSPDFVMRERRMRDDLLINMLAARQLETSKLPGDREIADLQAKRPQSFANRELWRLQQLVYETPTSKEVNDRIAATKSLEELASVLNQAGVSYTRATNQVVTDIIPPDIYPRLAALGPGEPFIVPNGARSVASSIVAREPAPVSGPNARAAAADIIRRESSTGALQQRLKDLRASAKIEYKEGFGPPAK